LNRLAPLPALLLLAVLPFAHTVALRLACLGLAGLLAAPTIVREWRTLPAAPAIALWSALCVASLAWSIRPEYTASQLRNEVLYPPIAFFALYATVRGEAMWRRCAWALAAGFVVLVALAIPFLWSPTPWLEPHGLLPDVNHASTYLLLVAPVAAAFVLTGQLGQTGQLGEAGPAGQGDRHRALLVVAAALYILTGWLTQNRTMWLAVPLQVALFAALYLWREHPPRREAVRAAIAVLAVGAAMLALFAVSSLQKTGTMPLDAQGWQENLDQSFRPQIWSLASGLFAERPWIGHGFGREILAEPLTRAVTKEATHAHNVFFSVALQMGIVGVACFVVLLASLARECWRLIQSSDQAVRIAGMAGLCLIAGALAKGMTDDPLVRASSLLFWALLGMLLGYARGRSR
jgi:O-antigen ligase